MKQPTVEDGNGKELVLPAVMDIANTKEIAQSLKNEINATRQQTDLSKYLVMEGMQNPQKRQFFTEYVNVDDVLRMNTIERYVDIAPLIIRKCTDKNRKRITELMQKVYHEHVEEHKENMSALKRKREEAYVRILSSDSSDSGVVPTGMKKFFGIGRK